MLPKSLLAHLEQILNHPIIETAPVSGGDIHHAARLRSADGRDLFVKFNAGDQAAEMFRTEALGLALLGASRVIATPKVQAHGDTGQHAYLLLDFVPGARKNRVFWETFGHALAALHGTTGAQFGFAHDNFIGSLPQTNTRCATWPEFYATCRLLPQLRLAIDRERLDLDDARHLERLCSRLDRICPAEPPALIHGDLWSGNFICSTGHEPVLVDPATCFAHREMDLAMSHLFGGFHAVFYQSYAAARPLEPGFEERMEVYQLYYLLAHVNLFGGDYETRVRQILKRWGQ